MKNFRGQDRHRFAGHHDTPHQEALSCQSPQLFRSNRWQLMAYSIEYAILLRSCNLRLVYLKDPDMQSPQAAANSAVIGQLPEG